MSDPEITKQGRGLMDVLQSVENALVDSDWSEIVVRCELGYFEWRRTHNPDGTKFVKPPADSGDGARRATDDR
jgi:hypothetical protein